MKTTIQQLSKDFSKKAGFDIEVNTFDELKTLLEDLLPVIRFNNSEDYDTSSFYNLEDGYFSSSNADCYMPEIHITAKKETIAKLMNTVRSKSFFFLDVDNEFELYEDFEDVPNGTTTLWNVMDFEKLNHVFEQLRAFSESEQIDLSVELYYITPENNCDDTIHFNFSKGKRNGGGVIKLVDDNSVWFPMSLKWLYYAFNGLTIDEISALGIEIDYQRFEGELLPPYDCGVLIGVNYKYGKTPHIFDSIDSTIALIERYPVLIEYLPNELKCNKQVVLTFIKANDAYTKDFRTEDDDFEDEIEDTESIIARHNDEFEAWQDIYRNACPYLPNDLLAPFYKDVDVLVAVTNSVMWGDYCIPSKDYDEEVIQEVTLRAPRFENKPE